MPDAPHLTPDLILRLRLERDADANAVRAADSLRRNDRVKLTARSAVAAHFAVRTPTSTLTVVISVVSAGRVQFRCECPAFMNGHICAHILASAQSLVEILRGKPDPADPADPDAPPFVDNTWEIELASVFSELTSGVRGETKRAPSQRGMLLFSVQERASDRWGVYPYSLPVKSFPAEFFENGKVTAAPDEVEKFIKSEKLGGEATGIRTVDPARFPNATALERQAATLLGAVASIGGHGYYYGSVPPGLYEQVLALLAGSGNVYQGSETAPLKGRVQVLAPDVVRPGLMLDQTKGGVRMAAALIPEDAEKKPIPIDASKDRWAFKAPQYLLSARGGTLSPLPATLPDAFRSLAQRGAITVPDAGREKFYNEYLLPLTASLPVVGNAIAWEEDAAGEEPVVVPRLYLSEASNELAVRLRYAYGAHEYAHDGSYPAQATERATDATGAARLRRVRRDTTGERERFEALSGTGGGAFGLKRGDEPGAFSLRARVEPIDFLLHYVPKLAEAGYEVFGDENLKGVRVNKTKPKLSFSVSSGIDWFDVDTMLTFGDTTATLSEVRKAIRRREKYVKLADGSIGVIPPEIIERFRFLFAVGEETKDGGLRLSSTQALLLEQAIADEGGDVQADAQFGERLAKLHQFEAIKPVPLPEEGLNALLYPYQKAGYDWLHFLHEYGFGGCLADEMGLGKTLSALAFLLSLRAGKNDGHPATAPSLVVVPKSLIFNWERESARFTPDLKILTYRDTSRVKDPSAFAGYDIVLTTYGILLRDIETLRQMRFHYAVLDEAQAIKNPLSQSARAARLLNCDHRLTLTGTPVENNTMELWSQFSFLNPGHLGGIDRFRETFAGAIERHNDEEAAQTLRKLVAPFLLRRTKEQVAKDLPPRTEQIVYCEMDEAQRKRYNELRDHYRAEVMGMMEPDAERPLAGKGQMKMLEALLRLRQVANHPRLADPTYTGEGAKFGVVLDTLETLREENHKALIFSQFVKLLDILRAELDKRGMPYVYLDGSTRDRQTPVDQFQTDKNIPFFLISLKAGGVGLNLTAADYVLHVDPWWNPAAERQATDRAHRIGQDKPVFVQKFITKGSVEEKILALQDKKRILTEQLITSEAGGFLKTLGRADIEALFS